MRGPSPSIVSQVTAVNRAFHNPAISSLSPLTAAGRAALDSLITEQAQVIAYIDDYKLLMIDTLAVIPLLVIFKTVANGSTDHHAMLD